MSRVDLLYSPAWYNTEDTERNQHDSKDYRIYLPDCNYRVYGVRLGSNWGWNLRPEGVDAIRKARPKMNLGCNTVVYLAPRDPYWHSVGVHLSLEDTAAGLHKYRQEQLAKRRREEERRAREREARRLEEERRTQRARLSLLRNERQMTFRERMEYEVRLLEMEEYRSRWIIDDRDYES